MNQVKEQETTFTLVTPSDVETIKVLLSYDIREFYTVELTKEEMAELDFNVDSIITEGTATLLKKEFLDCSNAVDIDEVNQTILNRWEEEQV